MLNEININVFGYENGQPYPVYISKEKFKNHIELLLITEGENKHYLLLKDFNKFMFHKLNIIIENTSVCIVYNASVLKKF